MDEAAQIVHPMKTSMGARVAAGDVVAVVGELLAGREARSLAHDLVALDDEFLAVAVLHDPFATEECYRVLGAIVECYEIDKRMRLVGGQSLSPMVVDEFVEAGGKSW